MASIVTCIATNISWCFCIAAGSLFSSCCGNDKPSSVPPGKHSGRKRSVLLLLLAILLALVFQLGIANFLVNASNVPDNFITDGWMAGCEKFESDEDLQLSCVGNAGNYRVTAAVTLFFLLAGLASLCKPTANREAWPAKYVLFLFLVFFTIFIPNEPLFTDVYLNIARAGGVGFILFEQILILDISYNWNESWVEKSNAAEAEEQGAGKKWLGAILASCVLLFVVTLAIFIYMFIEFTGCTSNNLFISITFLLCIIVTLAQLSGEDASLLTSACICVWSAFLCYTAVSKNPNESCNPRAGELSPLSLIFGLSFTLISLGWTGWSYTAETKFDKDGDEPAAVAPADEEEEPRVTGIVTGGETNDDESAASEQPDDNPSLFSNSWRLNLVLAFVSCWTAMVMTHWGEVQANGNIDNPNVGKTSMYIIMASQYLVMILYLWTLVAPRLFPNRDFS